MLFNRSSGSRKWLFTLLSLLVMGALVLAACGPAADDNGAATTDPATGDDNGETDDPPAEEPEPGEPGPAVGGIMQLRLDREPDNFNPILYSTAYGGAIVGEVFDSLFEFDTNWEPQPMLAESWDFEDELTLVINLKQGVKFHDGGDFTADDVVFTLMSIKADDYDGPRSSSMAPVESVTARDTYTVEIKLVEPFAPVLNNINYGIMQAANFEGTAVGDFGEHERTMSPIGTGPYKFVEYERGEYVILERNDDWHMSEEKGGAPFAAQQHWKVIPDDQVALAAFENGEFYLETPSPDQANRLKEEYAGILEPIDYERNGWGFMSLNTFRGHLQDKRIRQALTYGLDRQTIIDVALDGLAVVPVGPIPPVSWAFDDSLDVYTYDPDKANELLDEAGWEMGDDGFRYKDGEKLVLRFYGSSGSPLIENLTTIAKQNWADVGIDTVLELMDFDAMLDNFVGPGDYDITFYAFNLGLDPDSLYGLFHTDSMHIVDDVAQGFNRMRYSNPRVDELLEEGRREGDPDVRKRIYAEAQNIINEDAPVILVYSNLYTDFYNAEKVLGGVVNFPGAGASYLYGWWLEEQ